MNICESLIRSARIFPDKIAIVWDTQQLSYSQLNAASELAAQRLLDSGITPGDRVAMMLPNTPAFPVWYYAALRIGAIAVSVSTRLAGEEIKFILDDCQAQAFIGNSDAFSIAAEQLPDRAIAKNVENDVSGLLDQTISGNSQPAASTWYDADPNDPALILYTSGTTGFPKGATLSHMNVRSNVHAFNHLCNMQTKDVVLLAVPLFHCFGQNALLNSVLNVGGALVFQQKFDLNESKHLIARNRVTQLYGVPMMFRMLLESCTRDDLASVQFCFSAAAPLPVQVSKSWQEKFDMPIHEGYGLTETSPFASFNHRDLFVTGSIGTPIDCVEMKIVNTETGGQCAPGELGEIAIRGPNVMLGYWNRKEDTRQAIRNGWFHSGDIGRVDDQGYFYIVDRVKDMISIGGLKVFPAEIERVLLDHQDVIQTSVVGLPDPNFGEQIIAFVVTNEDCIGSDLHSKLEKHTRQRLGNYKIPRQFIVVNKLPLNPSGKILKTKLREMAEEQRLPTSKQNWDQHSNSRVPDDRLPKIQEPKLAKELQNAHNSEHARIATKFLQQLVSQMVESEHLPDSNITFIDAGLDSLMIVELTAQLQIEVGDRMELPATLIFDHPRISEMSQFLVQQLVAETNPVLKSRITKPVRTSETEPEQLRASIESMSEEQALAELVRELE